MAAATFTGILSDWSKCHTGNGEKVSSSQAEPGQTINLAAAYFHHIPTLLHVSSSAPRMGGPEEPVVALELHHGQWSVTEGRSLAGGPFQFYVHLI